MLFKIGVVLVLLVLVINQSQLYRDTEALMTKLTTNMDLNKC